MSAVWNMTGQDVTLGFCHADRVNEGRTLFHSISEPVSISAYLQIFYGHSLTVSVVIQNNKTYLMLISLAIFRCDEWRSSNVRI